MPSSRAKRFSAESRDPRIWLAAALLLATFSHTHLLFAQTAAKQSTHTFHDRGSHLSFDYPAEWTFAEHDHEISTFHLDARTAPRSDRLRAVIAMPANPFPQSTFSGAYLYFSVTPHSSASACARQAVAPRITRSEAAHRAAESRAADSGGKSSSSIVIPLVAKPDKLEIDGISFTHGRDEQREVCLTQHDDIYTTPRAGSCLRFDLAINNFCSASGSGAHDLTLVQMDMVRSQLTDILKTVRLEAK